MKINAGLTCLVAAAMAVALSLLTGCATTPTKVYVGPNLPDSQVAKITAGQREIKIAFRRLIESSKIISVDGQEMQGLTIPRAVHVLPGRHEIVAQVHGSAAGPSLGALGDAMIAAHSEKGLRNMQSTMIFNAEAGKEYVIRFDEIGTPKVPNYVYWIEEAHTGKYVCGWRAEGVIK